MSSLSFNDTSSEDIQFDRFITLIRDLSDKLKIEFNLTNIYLNTPPKTRDIFTIWLEFPFLRLVSKQYLCFDFNLYISVPIGTDIDKDIMVQIKDDNSYFIIYRLAFKALNVLNDFRLSFVEPQCQFIVNVNDNTIDCIISVKEDRK